MTPDNPEQTRQGHETPTIFPEKKTTKRQAPPNKPCIALAFEAHAWHNWTEGTLGPLVEIFQGTEPTPQNFIGTILRGKNPSKLYILYMGVSKNKGTPKWIFCNGKPY